MNDLQVAGVAPSASSSIHSAIDLRDVTKAYETPAGSFVALDRVSFAVPRGQFLAIVGKSGSGKSTLINVIAGIDRPSSGEILRRRDTIE